MAEIKLPKGAGDGPILVTTGDTPVEYNAAGGKVEVDDAHVASVLAAVPGSELVQATPVATPATQGSSGNAGANSPTAAATGAASVASTSDKPATPAKEGS